MNEEEKKAIEEIKELIKCFYCFPNPTSIELKDYYCSTLEIALNLIEKQQKEIERRKHDNKTLKEFVSAVFNEELDDKYIIHLTDEQYKKIIENAQNDINQKWAQKVKDKIEDLKMSGVSDGKDNTENTARELAIEALQNILEESEGDNGE